jgi:MraZ protein
VKVGKNGALWVILVVFGIIVNKMSDAVSVPKTVYNSCYRHGVDEKRRVQIPSKWRPEDAGVELTLIFWPKHTAGACLRVLPPAEMAQLMAEIDAMPAGDDKKVFLKRFIGSESVQVALDKAGRICLPDELARKAEIKDEAVLVGLLDRFEIWNPARYEKAKAADAVLAHEAFKLME